MRNLAFALVLSGAVLGAAQVAETPRVRTFLTYNIYECRKVRAWAIREPLASDHRPVALVVER